MPFVGQEGRKERIWEGDRHSMPSPTMCPCLCPSLSPQPHHVPPLLLLPEKYHPHPPFPSLPRTLGLSTLQQQRHFVGSLLPRLTCWHFTMRLFLRCFAIMHYSDWYGLVALNFFLLLHLTFAATCQYCFMFHVCCCCLLLPFLLARSATITTTCIPSALPCTGIFIHRPVITELLNSTYQLFTFLSTIELSVYSTTTARHSHLTDFN